VPSTSTLIRPARVDDRDKVWPLTEAFAASFSPRRAAFDTAWPQLIDKRDTLLLVAESPTAGIVGYLLAHSHLAFLANGPVAWVEELMVDASFRRAGIGHLLMHHAEQWARATGAAYVSLASRQAGPFYQALDYEDTAVFYKKPLS
jgi:GNAT superfamily N-acetyltransferase